MNDAHHPAEHSALARARSLVGDLTMPAVAAWKKANPGGLAIGCLPIYTPRPLLEAIGCLPVGIFGGGDQIDIIRGDSYFQSYICHIPRSTIELGLNGTYDLLDGMIFPSICDVIRNLGGMWKMLFEDRYTAYLDLPQNFDMALGGHFYVTEMRRIASELEALGARPLTPAALRLAVSHENGRRQALARLDALRRADVHRVPASEAYLVARAGSVLPAREHTELIDAYLEEVAERTVRALDNVRVVLVGSFCEQPPLALIRALELAGCDIVEDDFQLGLRMIEGDIPTPSDEAPLEALATAYLQRGVATASRYIDDGDKGAALVEQARAARADGVVFAAASFCDPALLDQPMLEAALTAASVPFTGFKFSENTGQFQVIREQCGAFSDSVKLWGTA